MNTTHTLRIEWDSDHFDVYIPELGPGVHATGLTFQEAEIHGNEAIARALIAQWEQEQKATA